MKITIGKKSYEVEEAKTEEELKIGLSRHETLKKNEGMLFFLNDESDEVTFNTMNMKFPIDIVFINLDYEVIDVKRNCTSGLPEITNDTSNLKRNDFVQYVLEVNTRSNIKIGDELDIEDNSAPVMKVLSQDGSEQYALWGGERIVSRKETKILIKKAKKADASKKESDLKSLGRYMFKVLHGQDNRDAEYVQAPQ